MSEQSYEQLWKENPLQLVEIPVGDIIILPELSGRSDYKRDPKKVKELTASIQEVGQIQPATVGLNTSEEYGAIGAPILFVGFGRYEACTAAKKDLLCMYSPLTIDHVLVYGMHENGKREDLSPIQFAANIERLSAGGMKDADIARKLGCSPGNVSLHRRFFAKAEDGTTPLFSPKALKAVHERKIAARVAYQIADLKVPDKIEKAIEKALEAGKGNTAAAGRNALATVRQDMQENPGATTKRGKKGKKKKAKTLGRSLPEVKTFLLEWDVANVPPAVRKTVQMILAYIDGTKDEKAVETVLMKLAA
jgi:ParB/RepB/Spo0J family partition protein